MHSSRSIYILGLHWNIFALFRVQKTLYLSYTGSLCSPSVQPLTETGCFKVPSLLGPPASEPTLLPPRQTSTDNINNTLKNLNNKGYGARRRAQTI